MAFNRIKTFLNKFSISFRLSFLTSILIFVFIGFGFYANNQLSLLNAVNNKIYNHPLKVSKASVKIEADIIRMHGGMKDLATSTTIEEANKYKKIVHSLENDVNNQLDTIRNNILGDKGLSLLDLMQTKFDQWKPIQEEISNLALSNKHDEALRITKNKCANYVDELIDHVHPLQQYPLDKAKEFIIESKETYSNSKENILISILSISIIMIVLTIIIIKSITHLINELKLSMLKMAQSDVLISSKIDGKNEIAEMALAFNKLMEKLNHSFELAMLSDIKFENINEQLQSSNNSKASFIANMSHEIRTPMNGIIGIIDLLEKSELDEEQELLVKTIKDSSKDLITILNDVLDISKIESGKESLKLLKGNINDNIEKVVRLFKPNALKNKSKIFFDGKKLKNVNYLIDEIKLTQVLSNLIGNAVKYTRNGTIEVKANIIEKYDGFSTFKVEIIDSGEGISLENQKYLFKEFQQLDQKSRGHIKGTGLGLLISKHIIKLMNGEIGVISKLGKGSNFWFTFQAYSVKNKTKESKIETFENDVKNDSENQIFRLHVLLTDDKIVNLTVAKLLLEKLGCTVETANNGQEAINKFEDGKYDLVLMDIQMPIMDGLEATQMIKKTFKNTPPIVALSANAMEGDAEKYLSLGFDDYIAKPVTFEVLSQELARINQIKSQSA